MNILVHLKIANEIMKVSDTQLNRFGFLLGNILPDLQHNRIKADHFFNESWPQIQLLSEQIGLLQPNHAYGRLTKLRSVDIGMICHYVSDYFCYAHSVQFKKNILHHLLYEAQMSFIPLGSLSLPLGADQDCDNSLYSWGETLQEAIEDHNSQPPSMRRDLSFAIEHGIRVSTRLAMKTGENYVDDQYLPTPVGQHPG